MKRNPLPRKTPLGRGDSELARTGFQRKPDAPKPTPAPKRHTGDGVGEASARRFVRTRSGGDCEVRIPDVCQGRATNFQHRWAQGQGGPWTASNGLDVCGMGNYSGCHGYIHQHPTEAKKNGWTIKPGKNVDSSKIAALIYDKDGHRDDYLLDNKGGATLAPWPEQVDVNPDDLTLPEAADEAGAA